MNDFMKWCFKVLLSAVVWVFILSVRWDGRPMFNYASEVLVQNAFVRAVDDEAGTLWTRFKQAARTTFSAERPKAERKG